MNTVTIAGRCQLTARNDAARLQVAPQEGNGVLTQRQSDSPIILDNIAACRHRRERDNSLDQLRLWARQRGITQAPGRQISEALRVAIGICRRDKKPSNHRLCLRHRHAWKQTKGAGHTVRGRDDLSAAIIHGSDQRLIRR
jgi:hypothetical protein